MHLHCSYMVRRSVIRIIEGTTVELTNGKQLVIRPLYREELKYISALLRLVGLACRLVNIKTALVEKISALSNSGYI